MYFKGVFVDKPKKWAEFAIVKKFQKNVKKHYLLENCGRIGCSPNLSNIVEDLYQFYSNNRYAIRKRLYSQDGRPTKSAVTPPRLVVSFFDPSNSALVMQLRTRKIAVESIRIVETGPWKKNPLGRALGDDYEVPLNGIKECLVAVYRQGRLSIGDCAAANGAGHNPGDQSCEGDREVLFALRQKDKQLKEGAFLALGALVWFREKVRYHRSYSDRR